MNRIALFPSALALLLALAGNASAQAPSQPSVEAQARPILDASTTSWLEGDWVGAGHFSRNGLPLASTYEFRTVHDGEAMTVRHLEHAPNTFAWSGVLSVDSRSGDMVLAFASNKGGGARVLHSEGWNGETLTFEASPELQAWFARERIIFQRLDSGRFEATYEMSRDGGATWRTGDVQTFVRISASSTR